MYFYFNTQIQIGRIGDDGNLVPAGTRSYDLRRCVGFPHNSARSAADSVPFFLRHRLWASHNLAQVLTVLTLLRWLTRFFGSHS